MLRWVCGVANISWGKEAEKSSRNINILKLKTVANRKDKLSAEEARNKYFSKNKGTKDENETIENDTINADPSPISGNDGFDNDKEDNSTKKTVGEPDDTIETPKTKDSQGSNFDDGTASVFGGRPASMDRDYTKIKSTAAAMEIESVPEPMSFEAPPTTDSFSEAPPIDPTQKQGQGFQGGNNTATGQGKTKAQTPPSDFRNPAMDDISKGEQKKAAAALADTIIAGYIAIHEQAKKFVKFDEQKALKEHLKGNFDMAVLGVVLKMPDGSECTVKQFMDQVANTTDDVLTVSEEFKEKVRPLLIYVLTKRGLGMTPEQELGIIVVMDILPKTKAVMEIKGLMTQVIDISKQNLDEMRSQNGRTNSGTTYVYSEGSAPQPPQQPQPPKQEPVKTPEPEQVEETVIQPNLSKQGKKKWGNKKQEPVKTEETKEVEEEIREAEEMTNED